MPGASVGQGGDTTGPEKLSAHGGSRETLARRRRAAAMFDGFIAKVNEVLVLMCRLLILLLLLIPFPILVL